MARGPSTGIAWFARTCASSGKTVSRSAGRPSRSSRCGTPSGSATSASTSSPWPTARPNPPAPSLVRRGVAGPRAAARRSLWFDLFNTVTLPFYWRDFEPEPGNPDTTRLLRAARWFGDRGCTVKGHPLVWHTMAPRWLLDLPSARGRGRDQGADHSGGHRFRRRDQHLGCDQRGGDHAGVREGGERDHPPRPAARARGDGPARLRDGPRGEPGRDAHPERLRHVSGLRAPDRGVPRGRHLHRWHRSSESHAPGLLG